MDTNIIKIGEGDPSGADEILLVNSVEGWVLVIPWGYDYGCGIHKVIKVTEGEVHQLIRDYSKNNYVSTTEILDKFSSRINELED